MYLDQQILFSRQTLENRSGGRGKRTSARTWQGGVETMRPGDRGQAEAAWFIARICIQY